MKRGIFASVVVAVAVSSVSAGDWTENVKIKGDLRYRHEVLDKDDDAVDARHRQRIRSRVAIEGKVSDATKVVIGLATGSDDPVSTNVTLGDFFTTKNFGLDLAYLTISPVQFDFATLVGGKMKNPFITPGHSELQWDVDLNPEGGALILEHELDNLTLSAVGSGLWIEERSKLDDSWIGAGQASARFHFNEKQSSVMVGGGYFDYQNIEGGPLFYDADDSFGNSFVAGEFGGETVDVYAIDYNIAEVFAEVAHRVGEVPVVLFGDYVNNLEADSLEAGWLVGVLAGKIKDPGSWAFRYIYRELDADAVVGAFADSDFREGGTNAKGHEIGAGYQLARNTTFNVTYFSNTIGIGPADTEVDFHRVQVDLQLKF